MQFNNSKKAQFAPAYDQAKIEIGETKSNTTGGKVLIKTNDACIEGISGLFSQVKHDFRQQVLENDLNDSKMNPQNKKEVGPPNKFRFFVCALALSAMSFNLMSRMIFNIAIVEMTRKVQLDDNSKPQLNTTTMTNNQDTIILTTTIDSIIDENGLVATEIADKVEEMNQQDYLDSLHYDWSAKEKNFLISAFYIGYAPSMMISGGFTDKYGAKYILLLTTIGSSVINLVTPYIASVSLYLLISSRIFLGILQGGLVPACYGLFNKWLTMTETSIFVPLTKVGFAVGSLIGTSLPGITVSLGYQWPFMFYVASLICALWALIWYLTSTSTPETNNFVSPEELRWILRKKQHHQKTTTNNLEKNEQQQQHQAIPPPPWLLIIKNPSVLALTLVKLTYNVGIDFIVLELSIYLDAIYHSPIQTISAIASGTCFMQLTLVTFVGWAAKVLVNNETFGLSRTKWRKIFQGASNFLMALMYFSLPFVGNQLWLAVVLMYSICFFWMLGAGGESMVPYDLSERYPATIVGVAQSFSVLSGFLVPSLCSVILGNENTDETRWNLMFNLLACALTFGGFVFVCVVKAKPFLPGEKVEKSVIVTVDGGCGDQKNAAVSVRKEFGKK